MDTQCNSIDIVNLREFALGLGEVNDVSIHPQISVRGRIPMQAGLLTPSTVQTQQSDVSPQPAALIIKLDNASKSSNIDHTAVKPNAQSRRIGNDDRQVRKLRPQPTKTLRPSSSSAIRHSASQLQFLSTVPDRHEGTMATVGFQSQGDTQPLSEGVQEEFASRIREQQGSLVSDFDDVQDSSHSSQPGGTGHIDLLAGFEQPFADEFEEQNGQDEDVDPMSQTASVRAELFPESKRFREPKTPATIGRKRSRDGSIRGRDITTPRLPINPFLGQTGKFEGMMDASQAFRATQFTSPLPNQVFAEGFSDRPSPDMYNPPRPSTADPTSSPARQPRSNTARAVTEPQTTYVSMKESQAERERLVQMSAPPAQDELDDGFDSDDSELRRRKRQRRLELEAKTLFEGVTARSRPRPSGRGRGGRRGHIQRPSPRRQSGHVPAEAVLISDDPLVEGNVTEDETEHEQGDTESDTDSTDELAEENKENIGIKRIQIPMTVSKPGTRQTIRITSLPSPSRPHPHKSASPTNSMRSASEPHGSKGTASTKAIESSPKATHTVAIVDSQPSPNTNSRPSPEPSHQASAFRHSSLEPRTVIPQSQPNLVDEADGLEGCEDAEVRRVDPSGPVNIIDRTSIIHTNRADLQTRDTPMDKSRSGGTIPSSTITKTDTTLTGQGSSTLFLNFHKETAIATGLPGAKNLQFTDIHDAVPDEAAQTLYEKVTLSSAPTVNGEHVPQSGKNTKESEQSEEQIHQLRVPSTIPESSVATAHIEPQAASVASSKLLTSTIESSKSIQKPQASPTAPSNTSTAYDTAATHLTASTSRSRVIHFLPDSSTPSPRKSRPRTLTEIAANPSPPDPVGSVDIDVNLVTAEDREFQAVLSGSSPVLPARKRRRGRGGQVIQMDDSVSDIVPPVASGSRMSLTMDNVASSSKHAGVDQTIRQVPDRNLAAVIDPASSPPRSSIEQLFESVRDDSDPGSGAMRTPSTKKPPPSSAVQTGSRKRGRPKKVPQNLDAPIHQLINIPEGDAAPTPKVLRIEVPMNRKDGPHDTANERSRSPVAPNRVFAHFNGKHCAAYYPATCIGSTGGKKPQYRVRFDDGTVDTINGYAIKSLELRPGDHIKIDLGGARKHVYVVKHMQNRQEPLPTPDPDTPTRQGVPTKGSITVSKTDIRGYASVVVSLKQGQSSQGEDIGQPFTVPIKDVYLTQTMWTSFKDRIFTYTPGRSQFTSRLQTPSERPSNASTPSSRTRRTNGSSVKQPRSARDSTSTGTGIFTNMAFAITNISDSSLRTTLKHHICNNGGRLLVDGFDELFHIPSLGSTSPSKRSPKKTTNPSFTLTNAGKETRFTCLLADKHCRMAKYIQALALGIPCLASRWVQDCVSKQHLLDWQPYMLAAGESSFLNGAVRSRLLPSFPPATTKLSGIIDGRPKPLDGDSVLLIMEKGEEEKMRSHPLITHALGARKVSRATSLDAAARAVEEANFNEEPWDWVYSHDKEGKVEKMLFGRGVGSSRKRKRGTGIGVDAGVGEDGRKTRVVGNEFVIQSLILGKLVE